jgi:hypothetical protein
MARLADRVAGVPRAPVAPFLVVATVCAGQVGCGRAWMRFHAVMIAVAQGPVAAMAMLRPAVAAIGRRVDWALRVVPRSPLVPELRGAAP